MSLQSTNSLTLFHPETLTDIDVLSQIEELLASIEQYKGYKFVFLGTNADTKSDYIRNRVKEFVDCNDNALYFENLQTNGYHYLLKNSICLIGNSSSGIIEAPSLGIYTINIGLRQDGRVRGNSIIDVPCNKKAIKEAIAKVMSLYKTVKPENPYYRENSANLYYEKTKELLERLEEDCKEPKRFYDL